MASKFILQHKYLIMEVATNKIVFVDAYTNNPGDITFEPLSILGDFVAYDRTSMEELPDRVKHADIVIVNKFKVDEVSLALMENVKYIVVVAGAITFDCRDAEAGDAPFHVVTGDGAGGTAGDDVGADRGVGQVDGIKQSNTRYYLTEAVNTSNLSSFFNLTYTRVAQELLMEEFHRISRLPPYVFNIVNELKAKARAAGEDIIEFGMGNPDQPTPKHIVDKMLEATKRPDTHRYSLSKGIPRLRKAICNWYKARFDVNLDPETEAIVTIGSKEDVWRIWR